MPITGVLQKMLTQLQQLQETLRKEEQALSARKVGSAALHRITETKNEQLTTLRYLDSQRQELEQQHDVSAPYAEQGDLHLLWTQIETLTRDLSRNNFRNGLLLRQHMKYSSEMLALLKSKSSHDLYGPDGHSAQKFPPQTNG